MLSLIILGKKVVTRENWDVYVQPLWLVGDNPCCWFSHYLEKSIFTCGFMYIFTMNDFLALQIVRDNIIKAYLGRHFYGLVTLLLDKRERVGQPTQVVVNTWSSLSFKHSCFFSRHWMKDSPTSTNARTSYIVGPALRGMGDFWHNTSMLTLCQNLPYQAGTRVQLQTVLEGMFSTTSITLLSPIYVVCGLYYHIFSLLLHTHKSIRYLPSAVISIFLKVVER